MGYRLTVRTGPRVERASFASLDDALDELAARAATLSRGPRRAPVDLRMRTFEPVQQVAHRLELTGPRGLRGGIDVRGDGSMEAYTGRFRRRLVAQQDREDAPAALARALQSTSADP